MKMVKSFPEYNSIGLKGGKSHMLKALGSLSCDENISCKTVNQSHLLSSHSRTYDHSQQ